jgi:hypothetical protein
MRRSRIGSKPLTPSITPAVGSGRRVGGSISTLARQSKPPTANVQQRYSRLKDQLGARDAVQLGFVRGPHLFLAWLNVCRGPPWLLVLLNHYTVTSAE